MKGEGRAVKSSVTDQDAVGMSTMYRRRCVTLGTVQVLSVPQFLYLQSRHKECLPPRVILRNKVIHSGYKVTYHGAETWQAEDKEGTGVRLPESKSQLHYLLPVWPGVSHLTYLCLNFLIGKVGIIKILIFSMFWGLNGLVFVKYLEQCLIPIKCSLRIKKKIFFLATPRSFQDHSSPTRDWTCASAVGVQSPSHWTAREFPKYLLNKIYKLSVYVGYHFYSVFIIINNFIIAPQRRQDKRYYFSLQVKG